MKLALIFLNRIEFVEDLLSALLEIGVSGATIVDSVGMGHIISHNIPIFAGLQDAFTGSSPLNKIILVLTNQAMVEEIAEVVEEICNTPDETASFVVSLPVDNVFGFKNKTS